MDEFSEKFQRGGGSFPIQKFLLQILDFWTGFFWHKNDTKGYFQGMFLSQPLPGWFVAPIFRRNDHVQTGICMMLPENRCHRVPVWVRGGGSNGYLGNAQMKCYIFTLGLPLLRVQRPFMPPLEVLNNYMPCSYFTGWHHQNYFYHKFL